MVSGQRPFQGQYDQALLYEIVHEEPASLTGLRTGVPLELEFVVGKCLTKDHDDRPESAKEVAKELRTLGEKLRSGRSKVLRTAQMTGAVTAMAGQTLNPVVASPLPTSVRTWQASFAVAMLALLGALAAIFTPIPPQAFPQPTRRFSISHEGLSSATISPDGRYVAFAVGSTPESGLWLRDLGSETAREIPGTEGARPELSWSSDSQAIVFATRTEIKRVGTDARDPVTLGDLPGIGPVGFAGASWSPDNERIVFSSQSKLWVIQARGGEPQILVDRDLGTARQPHFLPANSGLEALVYQSVSDTTDEVWVLNLETGERREVGIGSAPVYSRDGYVIYTNESGRMKSDWAPYRSPWQGWSRQVKPSP